MKRLVFLMLAAMFMFFSMSTTASASNIQPMRKGLGYKWNVSSIKYYSNIANTSERSAITTSMGKWNAVKWQNTCPVTQSLTTDKYCANTISYENVWYDSWIGYTNINSDWSSKEIYNVQVQLNSNYSFTIGATKTSFDFQSVLTHELGHALGVAHCHEEGESAPCWSPTCTTNVMRRNFDYNENRRNLTDYDTSSFIVIYW